jgi:hypothetical protein
MGNLNQAYYRRDYSGETLTYVEDEQMQSVLVKPRELPYDLPVKSAVVLGNGPSRISPEIQLLLNVNNSRPAEGYKITYACNAAIRDTPADYYVFKINGFVPEVTIENRNKVFTTNDIWLTYRDTNLIPYIYHMDAGSTAAYLAAFDGAEKVFLFGYDGTDGVTSNNIYENTLNYENAENIEDFAKFNSFLYNVIRVYKKTQFYRVRNHLSNDFISLFGTLPNYTEINVRDAVLLGDF